MINSMIPILLFHQIAKLPALQDPEGLAVSPEQFEKYMAFLHNRAITCLKLEEAINNFRKGISQPKNAVAITFDDGFQDLHSCVLPILKKYNFAATIFLVVDRVGRESDWAGQTRSCSARLLSWGQVAELAQAGFTFGSHTMTHKRLTEIDDQQAQYEIKNAKQILEDRLGTEIKYFSYPYSSHDLRIQKIVENSGYIAACGGELDVWCLFNLWRAQIGSSDNLKSFGLKVRGRYHQYFWLRSHLKNIPYIYPILRVLKRYWQTLSKNS